MKVISLGAGVQSSAMLLMALDGKLPTIPDCAVFADPGWETKATYDWLDVLEAEVAPFKIHRVSNGNIRDDAVKASKGTGKWGDGRFASMPFYLRSPVGDTGMGRRQCTMEYKIVPLYRFLRERGATARTPVDVWVGISLDECHRMKPARVKYAQNVYPLIDARLTREDCEAYLKDRIGRAVPKSSCIGCPFHDDAYWTRLKRESPEEYADAVEFDAVVRVSRQFRHQQFLHRSCVPLAKIEEFRNENQGRMFMDAFGNECEGMCGN